MFKFTYSEYGPHIEHKDFAFDCTVIYWDQAIHTIMFYSSKFPTRFLRFPD